MKILFWGLALLSTISAFADVYEASEDPKLAVNWIIEPISFEGDAKANFFIPDKSSVLKTGKNMNTINCIKKKGTIIGKSVLYKYDREDAGLDRVRLEYTVLSVCKYPELK